MNEEWRPIVGYKGIYEISNKGRIKRIKAEKGAKVGRILKPRQNNGYYYVYLSRNGIKKTCKVSRLVASAFIPNLENKPEVNHLDGNKAYDWVENLEWVTPKENSTHACRVLDKGRGEACNFAKLKTRDIPTIRSLLTAGKLLQKEIAEKFSVNQQTISCIKIGKTWAHV